MRSRVASHGALADALAGLARQQGAADPRVRGADWRQAIVATVDAAGLITTTDGITARRMESYPYPAAGDRIIITVSSAGSWIAAGRLVSTEGNDWQYPALASPWNNYNGDYQLTRYRRSAGEVILEGLVDTGGTSISGTTTIFTLPAGYRPPAHLVFPAVAAGLTFRQVNVRSTGQVDAMSLPSGAISFLSCNLRFSLS